MEDDAPDVTSLLERSLEGAVGVEAAEQPAEDSIAPGASDDKMGSTDVLEPNIETTTEAATEATAADGSPVEAPKAESKTQTCGICGEQPGKYKCPRCRMPYCSVACSRIHRDNHPPDPPATENNPAAPQQTPTAAAPSSKDRHPFSVLDDSPELRYLFKKYPNLPSALARVHAATLPPSSEQQQPPAGGLPWSLQQTAAYRKKQQAWTHDVGLRRGKDALRRARTDPGEDGEAVREYCELVLHLLGRQADERSGDVTAVVRREVNEEDVRLIEKLMEAEGA
ncbi:hypothetical protein NKR23_g11111 [Pleurostoma richardsiae]|uniref:HIT-type domain-containing protein n=1 Tax=Pleurostoma richardsiae TaxID=41990 RepID=A0AA38R3I0_9PEZI|nr:hypothetical protein NKR23_g11111 [Pleurostoma richardsiae]